MEPGEAKLVIERSSFAETKQRKTVYNISGWTVVASTEQVVPSFQRQSTLCFAGIEMPSNATFSLGCFEGRSWYTAFAFSAIISFKAEQMVHPRLDTPGTPCTTTDRVLLKGRRLAWRQDDPRITNARYYRNRGQGASGNSFILLQRR